MDKLPKVGVIGAGGAICAKASKDSWESGELSPQELIEYIPEIKNKFNLRVTTAFRTHSKNLQPEDWLTLANMIFIKLEESEGVVIPHGKDTLHYSASAISFMIQNLNKPIVFTGSQLTPGDIESDAKWNFYESLGIAAFADLAETVILYAGKIMRGTRAKQIRTATYYAFDSIGVPLIGKAKHEIFLRGKYKKRNKKKPKLIDKIEPNVSLIKMHPGFNPQLIEDLIDSGVKGIVLEGFGLGNIPLAKRSVLPAIEKAVGKEIPVVITTECQHTTGWEQIIEKEVEEAPYKAGVIPSYDMLSSTALVKLMWILGQTNNMGKVKKMMHTNYVGEITPIKKIKKFWRRSN